MPRQLSPYEKTHLARFSKSDINIDQYGEMPVEYITGKVEFDHKIFTVNQDVLIPRIETEELINLSFKAISNQTSSIHRLRRDPAKGGGSHLVRPGRTYGIRHSAFAIPLLTISDIGCGCGAIGIGLAERMLKENIQFDLFMSDVNSQIMDVARSNITELLPVIDQRSENQITAYNLPNQSTISLLVSDLLDDYPVDLTFDLLTANLPYIPTDRIKVLDPSVKDFEPHVALDGGNDGLYLIKKFALQAHDKLKNDGQIILEIDYTHDQRVLEESLKPFKVVSIFDQFLRQRFAILTKK